MGERDLMFTKQLSAYKFNATLSRLPLLPGKNANETATYFETLWNILAPRKKVNTTKVEKNYTMGDFKEPIEAMSEQKEERPVGDIIEGNVMYK